MVCLRPPSGLVTPYDPKSVLLKTKKAGEGVRTLDVHVGNVVLYH
jgi:hypothetical protein